MSENSRAQDKKLVGNNKQVVDAHYRGNVIVAIHNDSSDVQIIHHGDRIAQFMLAPVIETKFEEVDELTESDRGEGGFGSSGK